MWKFFFKPEVLFFIGTFLALVPYAFWPTWDTPLRQIRNPNYDPVYIYGIGFFAFIVGCRVFRLFKRGRKWNSVKITDRISWSKLQLLTIVVVSLLIIQLILVIVFVYRTIPVLGYLQGTISVADVNELQQASMYGQLGILSVTKSILTGIVALLFVFNVEESKRVNRFFWGFLLAVLIFSFLMGGKRQGLFMFFTFILCAVSFVSMQPLSAIFKSLRVIGYKFVAVIVGIVMLPAAIWIMGSVFQLRTGEDRDAFEEVKSYLSYPLINMEYQTELAGLGPGTEGSRGAFRSMLPMKSQNVESADFIPKLIFTSPSGFYSKLQWYWGIGGIIFGAFLAGFISYWFYYRARHGVFYLLVYCQICWALLSIHSYNHFLNLVFLPVPCFVFFTIDYYLKVKGKKSFRQTR